MDGSRVRSRLALPSAEAIPWVPLAIGSGLVLAVPHLGISVGSLGQQVLRDGVLLLAVPLALASTFGRRLGWRVDRRAALNALGLTAFVLPFYVVGSVLPSIRAHYPFWGAEPTLVGYLPYALGMFVIVVAAETFYRGLLCVSVREIGLRCVLISPVIYVIWHFGTAPIELLLAAPADVLFGVVDYRTESILPSVLAHATGFILLSWLVMHPPVIPQDVVLGWLDWLPVI